MADPVLPPFRDGIQDYNDKLNALYNAFMAGPYSAVPLAGNVAMTGPLTIPTLTLTNALAIGSGGTGGATAAAARAALGLGNVDNTADAAKPVSTPQATALALKADAASTTAALATKANVNSTGMKNRLINGDFRVNQRGSVTGGGKVHDCWVLYSGGTAMGGSGTFLGINFGGIYTSVATFQGSAGNTGCNLQQGIVAEDVQDLAGRVVTLSYWYYQTTGTPQNINSSLYTPNSRNVFTATTVQATSASTVVPSGVWTKLVFTFTAPSSIANGAVVVIGGGQGAVGAAQNIAIGDAQFELGSEATLYDRRSRALEVFLCQRTYETGTYRGSCFTSSGNSYIGFTSPFKTNKSRVPTITWTDAQGTANRVTSAAANGITVNTGQISADGGSLYSDMIINATINNSWYQINWVADASLIG